MQDTGRSAWGVTEPKGTKDPNDKASGRKYYDIHGMWALKTSYLVVSLNKGTPI